MKKLPVIAIVGPPNAGKSTLFNRIVGFKKAIVADIPGVTRDRNYAKVTLNNKEFFLVDTGGFEENTKDIIPSLVIEQTKLAIEEADKIIVICDGKIGLTPDVYAVINLLREKEKDFILAINKMDNPQINFPVEFYSLGIDKIFSISSEHKIGIDTLFEEVLKNIPEKKRRKNRRRK